jgi:hypothetical protein
VSSIGCRSARSGVREGTGRSAGTLLTALRGPLRRRPRGAPGWLAVAGTELGQYLCFFHFFRKNARTFSAELPTAFTAARNSDAVQLSDLHQSRTSCSCSSAISFRS